MYHLYNLAYDAQVWFSEEGKMKPQRKTVDDRSSMITYYMDVLEIMTVAGRGLILWEILPLSGHKIFSQS